MLEMPARMKNVLTIVDGTNVGMILEVLSHSWQIDVYWQAELLKDIWLTNARQFKYLRGVNTSRCKYDFSRT